MHICPVQQISQRVWLTCIPGLHCLWRRFCLKFKKVSSVQKWKLVLGPVPGRTGASRTSLPATRVNHRWSWFCDSRQTRQVPCVCAAICDLLSVCLLLWFLLICTSVSSYVDPRRPSTLTESNPQPAELCKGCKWETTFSSFHELWGRDCARVHDWCVFVSQGDHRQRGRTSFSRLGEAGG